MSSSDTSSTSAPTTPITTPGTTAPTSNPSPTTAPPTVAPSPSPSSDTAPTNTKTGGNPKPKPPKTSTYGSSTTPGTPTPTDAPSDNGNGNQKKSSVVGPVVGAVCGVVVLAFIIGVIVLRYKKKSKARKRRLDFLNDGHAAEPPITSGFGPGGNNNRPVSAQNVPRPSTPSGNRPSTPNGNRPSNLAARPLEMAAVGGGGVAAAAHLHHNNEGYDYQQGYQQVSYGGYPQDQYEQQSDQYDPYYAQNHGYYADGQQQQQYQNQYAPSGPLGYGSPSMSQGTTGSPSMTHVSDLQKNYPPPPPSTVTGGHSSPRTPLQSEVMPVGNTYEKNAIIENEYAGTHSARNPQLVPENEDRIKVPL